MTSRMCSVPQIHATVRSRPRPKPELFGSQRPAEIVTTLAANNFAITLGGQHIESQRQVRTLGIGLHIKRLDRRRIAMHHDRAIVER